MQHIHFSARMMGAFALLIVLTLCLQYAQATETWSSMNGPSVTRNVKDIPFTSDGTTGYATDLIYLFKTTNGGVSWFAAPALLAAPSLVTCKPDNPDYVNSVVSGKVFYSSDGGSTFYRNEYILDPISLATSPATTSNVFLGTPYQGAAPIYISQNNGGTFAEVYHDNFPYTTDVNDIAPSPNDGSTFFIAGSDELDPHQEGQTDNNRGVFYTRDLGTIWTRCSGTEKYDVEKVAVYHPGTEYVIYMYTKSHHMYVSTNTGNVWSDPLPLPSAINHVSRIAVQSTGTVWIATDNGVYKSTNQGSNWALVASFNVTNNTNVISLAGSSTIFAANDYGLWRSTDNGANWSEADDHLGRLPASSIATDGSMVWGISPDYAMVAKYYNGAWHNNPIDIDVHPQNISRNTATGDILLTGVKNQKPTLYRSTNSGGNFDEVTVITGAVANANNIFMGSFRDPSQSSNNYLYVHGLYQNGSAWNNLYVSSDYTNLGSHPFSGIQVGSTADKINDMALVPGNSSIIYFALNNHGIYKSTTYGSGATQYYNGMQTVLSLAVYSESVVYMAGPNGLWRTTNNGANWSTLTADAISKVILRPGCVNNGNYIAIVRSNGTIAYSNDGGYTLVDCNDNIDGARLCLASVSGTTPVMYAGSEKGVFSISAPTPGPTDPAPSNNAGNVSIRAKTLGWGSVTGASYYHLIVDDNSDYSSPVIDVPPTSTSYTYPGLAWGCNTSYFWKVAGGNIAGEVYSSYSFTTGNGLAIGIDSRGCTRQGDECHAYVYWNQLCDGGGDGGFSKGTGENGLDQPNSLGVTYTLKRKIGTGGYSTVYSGNSTHYEDYYVTWLLGQTNNGYFAYYFVSASTYKSDTQYVRTNIIDKPSVETIPMVACLHANYPNPFNPATTIDYDLSRKGHVSIRIYDVLGREVAILVNDVQDASYHAVRFNGAGLSSGIYFCRLETEGVSKMSKMLMTK